MQPWQSLLTSLIQFSSTTLREMSILRIRYLSYSFPNSTTVWSIQSILNPPSPNLWATYFKMNSYQFLKSGQKWRLLLFQSSRHCSLHQEKVSTASAICSQWFKIIHSEVFQLNKVQLYFSHQTLYTILHFSMSSTTCLIPTLPKLEQPFILKMEIWS